MEVVHLSNGQIPGKRGAKKQDSDTAFNQIIINRLGEIHEDIGKVHSRVDDLARDTAAAISEMVKVQANSLTKDDCRECKDERDKEEVKRHGVSPRVALVCTVGGGIVGNVLYRVPWDRILRFLKGG